jgi:hypothetical protein
MPIGTWYQMLCVTVSYQIGLLAPGDLICKIKVHIHVDSFRDSYFFKDFLKIHGFGCLFRTSIMFDIACYEVYVINMAFRDFVVLPCFDD